MIHPIEKLKGILHRDDTTHSSHERPPAQHAAPEGTVRVLPAQVLPGDTIDARPLLQSDGNNGPGVHHGDRSTGEGSVKTEDRRQIAQGLTHQTSTASHVRPAGESSRDQGLDPPELQRLQNLRLDDAGATPLDDQHSRIQSLHGAGTDSSIRQHGQSVHVQNNDASTNSSGLSQRSSDPLAEPSNSPCRRFSIARKPVNAVAGTRTSVDLDTDRARDSAASQQSENRDAATESVPHTGTIEQQKPTEYSEDMDVRTNWAPAVTHEKVDSHIHHEREEHIYSEIHTHDVFHRILPIKDVRILPARHFVQANDGSLREVTPEQISGRIDAIYEHDVATGSRQEPSFADVKAEYLASRMKSDDQPATYTDEHGVVHQTSMHCHPPVLETGGITSDMEKIEFP